MTKTDRDFVRGYVCAVCCMLESYGGDVEARDALRCIGFASLDLKMIDVADRQTLRKWGFIPRRKE